MPLRVGVCVAYKPLFMLYKYVIQQLLAVDPFLAITECTIAIMALSVEVRRRLGMSCGCRVALRDFV